MKHLTFFTLIFIAAAIAANAQAKSAAHKFDEFTSEGYNAEDTWFALLEQRADRLEKRMRLERGKRMVIIGYRGRIAPVSAPDGNGLAKRFRWLIGYDVVGDENTVLVDGGIREFPTIEVWIAPKGADVPQPTPAYVSAEAVDCPVVSIEHGSYNSEAATLRFSVGDDVAELGELKWTVTGADIVERGENGVTVQADRGPGSRAIAYLEIPAVKVPCDNRFSATAHFRYEPQLIDRFGRLPNGDMRARFDFYLAELSNNPASQGVVHIYGSRSGGAREAAAFERLLRNHLRFRGFDPERITIVDAGYREEMLRELWIVHPGTEMPSPAPTVDKKFTASPSR